MNDLQTRHGYWQQRAFGDSLTDQGLISHMKREILEIEKATRNEEIEEECADLLLLLLGFAHKKGFSLLDASEAKFAKVQKRTWNQPDAEGVIEHVRSHSEEYYKNLYERK
jgi:NTP pyrophosphatase (non-canonical NTP hydrolase)